MEDSQSSSAGNLRAAAVDLSRRLSSLHHFLPAAHELLAWEQLSSDERDQHSRKIVALIEIARSTLLRHHVRLFQFTGCDPALAQHKEAYFNLLRMLKRIRGHFSDDTLHERIVRLLLSLSTSMHIVLDADKRQNTACCTAEGCHDSLESPSRGLPSPVAANRPLAHHRRSVSSAMPPPDIRPTRAHKRKLPSRDDTPESDPDPDEEEPEPPRGRRIRRCLDGHESHFYGHEDEEEPLSFSQKPVRRFGILFTLSKQYQRHSR